MSGMTKEQITTVVSGILDVLDRIDHNDWQGEAIQYLRNTLEPPTSTLPSEPKRCHICDDYGQRCIKAAMWGIPWCDPNRNNCNFGPDPESKPAPKPPPENETTKDELLRKICPNCDHYVSRCICEPVPDSPTCPARVPVFGMEAVTIANAALTS